MKSHALNRHLHRRPDRAGGWWYYRAVIFDHQVDMALNTQDVAKARELRDHYDELYDLEKRDRRLGRPPRTDNESLREQLGIGRKERRCATFAEVKLAYFADAPGRDIRARTARYNWTSLELVVREVLGADALLGQVDCLDWNLAHDFEAGRLRRAKELAGVAPNPEAEKTALITAASTLGQAQSVFCAAAQHSAEMRQLRLPDLAGFRDFKPRMNTRKKRVPVDDATLQRLKLAVDDLWFQAPARWLAAALCCNLGLRRGEAKMARWSWVLQVGGVWQLHVMTGEEFTPKGNEHKKDIRADLWADMCAVRSTGDFIIPGETAAARDAVLAENVQWLRAFGFEVNKPTHELRAIFAQVMQREHDARAASAAMGHGDATLIKVYAGEGTSKAIRPV